MYIYLVYLYSLLFEYFWFYVRETHFSKISVSFQSPVALDQSVVSKSNSGSLMISW